MKARHLWHTRRGVYINFNESDVIAQTRSGLSLDIAQNELNQNIEQQANTIAPELTPWVPKLIKVERVGFTRNASNTPYIVAFQPNL